MLCRLKEIGGDENVSAVYYDKDIKFQEDGGSRSQFCHRQKVSRTSQIIIWTANFHTKIQAFL